ncbi:MAG TPA: DUF5916 domain-containing protein [Gemmatimonadaceae bacterium]|nr:DUF5916 domain-containing protein [Gemmatimonadaceae bacterium]
MPFASILALLSAASTSDPQTYNGRDGKLDVSPPRVQAETVVDGRLDEPVWAQAARLTGFSVYAPTDGRPAPDSTEVLVWYSAKAIHFGIRAYAEPGTVRASLGDRDKSYADDYVGIFLSTGGDGRQATVFAVNPLGVQGDGIVVEGARSSGGGFSGAVVGREPTDISPDFVFQSKGRLTDFGYEVEIAIPFKSLQFSSAATQTWGINVLRKVQSRGEEHSWAPAKRAAASFIGQFGKLSDLQSLDRGLVLDVTPIVTARADGRRVGDEWDYASSRPQFGANVRWGLTSNLTLNGTIKPDFAEVESDAGQVVSDPRQTLFFPEKRPFFLDGAEQFSTPGGLIYTRRIASPAGAAKITGTLGGMSVAALLASDARGTSLSREDRPAYVWLRTQKPLGGGSRVGMVYTGRMDGPFTNHVAGADGRLVLGKIYSAQGLLALAHTKDPNGSRSAPMVQLAAARSGQRFAARYTFSSIADDFYTASGFISRDSITNLNIDHGLTFFGKDGGLLQTARFDVVMDGTWRYATFTRHGDASEKKLHFNTNYALRGGWNLTASLLVESYGYDADLYRNYYIERRLGASIDTIPFTGTPRIPNLDYVLSVNSPNFKHLSFSAFYLWGRDENFFEWASSDIGYLTLNADWRPTSQLRVSQSYVMQSYRRRTDGSLVGRSQIPRFKTEYQLSRSMLVRAVAEYQSFRQDDLRDESRTGDPLLLRRRDGTYARLLGGTSNQLLPELLFAYTPMPGTVFFAGYGGSVTDDEAYRFKKLRRQQDQLFVKMSYLLRM